MSFTILSRAEFIAALREAGIDSPFFEAHPVDAISDCKYHVVRNDVEAGCYPFEFFIARHKEFTEKNEPFTLGEVRIHSQSTYWKQSSALRVELEKNINNGVIA